MRLSHAFFLALLAAAGCGDTPLPLPPLDGASEAAADLGVDLPAADGGPCGPGTVRCGGTCVDTNSDPAHCGGCNQPCDPGELCSAGSCALSCQQGLVECAERCIDPLSDLTYCGAADDCQGQNAGESCDPGEVCSAGSCALSCQQGLVKCAGKCVDPLSDLTFCGAADDCQGANAGEACDPGEVCSTGTCALSCQQGLVDCNGKCIDPLTDRTFCGATDPCDAASSGDTCDPGEVCSAGSCALSCQQGLVECAGTCIDPLTDRNFCGASGDCLGQSSGEACDPGEVCSAGSCALSCQQGLVECAGTCIDPLTDRNFCGASSDCLGQSSGEQCNPGQICDSGSCKLSCQPGLIDCFGTCVNPLSDRNFCGASSDCQGPNAGEVCDTGQICSGGSCILSCPQGQIDCDNSCIDPLTDLTYCGASSDCQGQNAGETCGPSEVCADGSCELSCPQGQIVCDDSCTDPLTDHDHCGASGDCLGPNAGETCGATEACFNGSCVMVAQTVTLDAIHRGWWNSTGTHTSSNNNTGTGFSSTGTEYNSYFIFDLGSLSGTVLALQIKLELEAWISSKSDHTLTIWDVSTDTGTLEASGSGQPQIFDDLGSGSQYGSFHALQSQVGQVLTTALGGDAAAHATTALGGEFAIGVHCATAENLGSTDAVRFSAASEQRIHQLVVTYVP